MTSTWKKTLNWKMKLIKERKKNAARKEKQTAQPQTRRATMHAAGGTYEETAQKGSDRGSDTDAEADKDRDRDPYMLRHTGTLVAETGRENCSSRSHSHFFGERAQATGDTAGCASIKSSALSDSLYTLFSPAPVSPPHSRAHTLKRHSGSFILICAHSHNPHLSTPSLSLSLSRDF